MKKLSLLLCTLCVVLSCTAEKDIPTPAPPSSEKIVERYVVFGASTATQKWSNIVAQNISNDFSNYAYWGGRWTNIEGTKINLATKDIPDQDNVLLNQFARLLEDKKNGYAPDLITIFCGLNDIRLILNGGLGDEQSAFVPNLTKVTFQEWLTETKYKQLRETLYGSVKFILEKLKIEFPNTHIVVLTLHHCYRYPDLVYQNIEMVNKALCNVAKRLSIPVIDVFGESGITAENGMGKYYFQEDLLHLNENGNVVLARYITAKLKAMYIR